MSNRSALGAIVEGDAGMEILFPIFFMGVFGLIIFSVMKASKALARNRQDLQNRVTAMQAEILALEAETAAVDLATQGRVHQAFLAVREKLAKAQSVAARGRDRDFLRANAIVDQAQAKLDNARGGLSRAHVRILASQQRKAESEARKAQFAADKSARRSGSFAAAGVMRTSRETDWATIPTTSRGVCFFCSRPSTLPELTPVTVTLNGQPHRVLACGRDYSNMQSGATPFIRSYSVGGRSVPWYAYDDYDPYRDYYALNYDIAMTLDAFLPVDAVDPGYWNWDGGQGNRDYVFSADQEGYRDYYSGQAAGSGDYAPGADGNDYAPDPGGEPGPDFANDPQDVGPDVS